MHKIKDENKRAILISRAIVIVEDKLLVCESPDKSYCYLIGGHVELYESVKFALLREIEEETKETGCIKEYLGFIECEFINHGKHICELGHYFRAEIPKLVYPQIPDAYEEGLTFRWLSLAEIEKSNLRPDILRTFLPDYINGKREAWNYHSVDI